MKMSSQRIKTAAFNRASANKMAVPQSKPLDFFGEVSRIVESAMRDSSFIFAVLVTAFVVMTHIDDLNDGPLGEFFHAHQDNKIVAWILRDIDKFFGVLMFIPPALRAPKTIRSVAFSACAVGVIVLPSVHIWAYLVAAVSVMFFINFRNPMYKLALLAGTSLYLYNDYKATNANSAFPAPVPI